MRESLNKTDRSRVRRAHHNADYDRRTAHRILDAQPQCTVGYVVDGRPYVTPTLQWRMGDRVFWHGSSASRALRAGRGTEVCLSVSIFDGFVMARSGFNHSVNYRSLILFGTADPVEDADKARVLDHFIERMWPGRRAVLRPDRPAELKATALLSLRIDEGSMKIRSGPTDDEAEDYDLPIWAGVIPVRTVVGAPQPDPRNLPGVEMPDHIRDFDWPDDGGD